MDIGIGIPNSVRGTTGPQLLEWARRKSETVSDTCENPSIDGMSHRGTGRPD